MTPRPLTLQSPLSCNVSSKKVDIIHVLFIFIFIIYHGVTGFQQRVRSYDDAV
jgi:hypothetical protein